MKSKKNATLKTVISIFLILSVALAITAIAQAANMESMETGATIITGPNIAPKNDNGSHGYISGAYVYREPCLNTRTKTYLRDVNVMGTGEIPIIECHTKCEREGFSLVNLNSNYYWVRSQYVHWQ